MNEIDPHVVPLSELIRERRNTLNLKQAQIGNALNVTPESVGHWERGTRRIELNKLPQLAASLQLNEQDVCRLALFESHPCLYASLFGSERPPQPRCLE
jgi:transcriptional regulator with XRE-family HTH domain